MAIWLVMFGAALTVAAVQSHPASAQTGEASAWDIGKARAAVQAAIPKAAQDRTRPVYHFRPPAQWMNDICGAIHYKGYYHIFYQYNPFSGDRWGDDYTAWAHARSKNLLHWEDLPWAITPMKGRGERRCNSGCVTRDGNGRPRLFYTFVNETRDSTRHGKREQWSAIPLDDDLITWRRVPDGSLMAAGMNGVPEEVDAGWSDPFVFRSGGRTFVTFKSCEGLVCEAMNAELTQWNYVGHMDGVDGECPNVFPLGNKWVLLRSTKPPTYVVGDFDPRNISFDMNGRQGVLDYGFGQDPPEDRAWTRGLYATNTFCDDSGRCLMVGWVCGFKPGRGWNGCMSLPRVLSLDADNNLLQRPAAELKNLRGRHMQIENLDLRHESRRLDRIEGDTLEIIAEFKPNDARRFGLKVRCSEDGRNALLLSHGNGILDVAGTEVPVPLDPGAEDLTLHVFLDKSVMEVFINDGPTSVTRVDYPGENDLGLAVFAEGSATVTSLDVWEMKAVW